MTDSGGMRLPASETFTVPKEIRHLSADQVDQLDRTFTVWRDGARTQASRRSRERLRMAFLLLRHTGARLGEVLALDELLDIDTQRGSVLLGKDRARRDVPLPEDLCRSLRLLLQSPEFAGLEGNFFRLDPGYVRRVFYARAEECGFPRELSSPRILRNTRAVELLRSGVPLAVVRDVLGQSSTDLTAVFQHYSGGAASTLVRRLALRDFQGRTSARNTFIGSVATVLRDGVMAEVVMETRTGRRICAVITLESLVSLRLEPGVPVVATIKAPLVNVYHVGGATRSAVRNRVVAEVTSLRSTEVIGEISGRTTDGENVCALLSAGSMKELGFAKGDMAEFRFKSLAVVLNTV
ncbi:MAG: TOBE domain-containing protein [Desulfovibrio sp.]